MHRCISTALFLFSASIVLAQADSNSLTVTASRTLTAQPDQAVFTVFVFSGQTTSLDEVLAAVQPGGITLANFTSVLTGGSTPGNQLEWAFTVVGPLTNTAAIVATLTNLKNTMANSNPNLTLSFAPQSVKLSAQASLSLTCPLPDLLNEAKAKAQTLATAAGRFVSGLTALSTTSSPGSLLCSVTAKYSLVGF